MIYFTHQSQRMRDRRQFNERLTSNRIQSVEKQTRDCPRTSPTVSEPKAEPKAAAAAAAVAEQIEELSSVEEAEIIDVEEI